MSRTGLPQSVPRLQARRRARFAGSFVCSTKACKPRAKRSAAYRRASPVTVRANDLALLDLLQYRVPRARQKTSTNVELFVAKMIELKDNGVGLTAVHAWV